MNEKYLWDKTGNDADIEALESMLSAFRYQETAPPVLPVAKVVIAAKKAPWWPFSLGFAFAGAVVLVVLGAGLFWPIPPEVATVRSEIPAKPIETSLRNDVAISEQLVTDVAVSKTVTAHPIHGKQIIQTRFRPQRAAAKQEKVEVKDLTKEEKFAYDQLMLALSITSSKLKIVQDTIENAEPAHK